MITRAEQHSIDVAKATPSSEQSRLLSLPPELRLVIYEHLWDEPRQCSLIIANKWINCFNLPCFGYERASALLRTCKQVNAEATPVLYSGTTFKVLLFGHPPALSNLHRLAPIGSCATLKHIRRLSLQFYLHGRGDIDPILHRVCKLLRQLPCHGKLEISSANIALSGKHYNAELNRELATSFLTSVLAVERETPGLSQVSKDVYHEIRKDALRVVERFETYPS